MNKGLTLVAFSDIVILKRFFDLQNNSALQDASQANMVVAGIISQPEVQIYADAQVSE